MPTQKQWREILFPWVCFYFCFFLVQLPAKNVLLFCPFHQRSNVKCIEAFEEVSCGEPAAEQRAQTQRTSLFCCCMNLHFCWCSRVIRNERQSGGLCPSVEESYSEMFLHQEASLYIYGKLNETSTSLSS